MAEFAPMYEGDIVGTEDLIKNVLVKALSCKLDEVKLVQKRTDHYSDYVKNVEEVIRGISIGPNDSKEEILSKVCRKLETCDASAYSFSLIAALVEGRLEAIEAVLELRDKYHEKLSAQLIEFQSNLQETIDDEDADLIRGDLATIQRELEILRSGPLNRIVELLISAEALDERPRRPLTPFEENHALVEINTPGSRQLFGPQLDIRVKLAALFEVPLAELLRLEGVFRSKNPIEDRSRYIKFLMEYKKNGITLSDDDKAALGEFIELSLRKEPEPDPEPVVPEPVPKPEQDLVSEPVPVSELPPQRENGAIKPVLRKRRPSGNIIEF